MTSGHAYEVRIHDAVDRSVDVVHVWAPSPSEAVDLAIYWIDFISRRPLRGSEVEVHELGSRPTEDLLGIAGSFEDVWYVRTTLDGKELSTPFFTSEDEIHRLTSHLRTTASLGWEALRAALHDADVDPMETVVAEAGLTAADEPADGILASRDGRVFAFLDVPGSTRFQLLPGQSEGGSRTMQDRLSTARRILTEDGDH